MKDKILKLNCSFCGKKIECPEGMKDSDKHSCFECYQDLARKHPNEDLGRVHVDIPPEKFGDMANELIMAWVEEEVFPGIWNSKKHELKNLSRRELAEAAFLTGSGFILENISEIMKELKENFERCGMKNSKLKGRFPTKKR